MIRKSIYGKISLILLVLISSINLSFAHNDLCHATCEGITGSWKGQAYNRHCLWDITARGAYCKDTGNFQLRVMTLNVHPINGYKGRCNMTSAKSYSGSCVKGNLTFYKSFKKGSICGNLIDIFHTYGSKRYSLQK